ncbi:hypothetical protein [Massilia alkalitolerans]|uniref:hypothetical protein n=1 Tax=Massilia alkalitolerans TaxID=286638 RepID=UPI000408A9D1|nr:hypothetical protein [Massilia alkalitolerans]
MNQQKAEQAVYLDAYSTVSGSLEIEPTYAKITAGDIFMAQIKRLHALCQKEQLNEVRLSYAPDMWGPVGVEDSMRGECPELVVTQSSFWFADRGRHQEGHVETRSVSILHLTQALASATGPIFLCNDPAALENFIAEEEQDDEEEDGMFEAFR